ncbi:TrmH family RNA methyltransferase [Deinococcus aquiradiocola]|nr:RNA methyltransferase [Deinococcus aquiradiocola]
MSVPEPVHSLQNPQVKRLVRLKSRRERDAEGVWLVEGARELSRAHEAGVQLRQLFVCPDLYSDEAREVAGALQDAAGNVTVLGRAPFEKASHRENPDGLLALAEPFRPALPEPGEDTLVLLLMGLEKPGNLGALLRTADGVGVDAVLVVGDGTDLGNPGVIRASQGSVFSRPVAGLPEADALAWLRRHGFRLVACTPEASTVYWDAPLTGRVALCLGSEHDGLPAHWREQADVRVGIPMQGQADSLNVSVAGALVLYEALRQRRAGRGA